MRNGCGHPDADNEPANRRCGRWRDYAIWKHNGLFEGTEWPVHSLDDYNKTRTPCGWDLHCGNGKCLDRTLVCNGVRDCSNGADEANCSPTIMRAEEDFVPMLNNPLCFLMQSENELKDKSELERVCLHEIPSHSSRRSKSAR